MNIATPPEMMTAQKPLRILYFHQHFSTPKGAVGTRSYEMARRAIARGHEVTIVCGSYLGGATGLDQPFVGGRRQGKVDGINVIEYDVGHANADGVLKRSATFLSFAMKSIGVALRHDYDLVFATTTPLTAGIPGIAARFLRRKPFVFEVRDLWPQIPREMGIIRNPVMLAALEGLEWMCYRTSHRQIALSPGIADGIARKGVDPSQIVLVPNGCDITIFADEAVQSWRPDGVAETDLMAVFTGTHGVANGLDAVLDSAALLQERGRDDIKLVFVGNGRCKPDLVARAARDNLKNVIFHDPVPKARLSELMAGADIGLQCMANVPGFYYGTSPNKFFDYIAAGLPVLNNYPGWLADMISAEDCGFTVPPGDAQAFADALEQAASDPDRRRQMGQNGAALARREFDRRILADRWVDWVADAKR